MGAKRRSSGGGSSAASTATPKKSKVTSDSEESVASNPEVIQAISDKPWLNSALQKVDEIFEKHDSMFNYLQNTYGNVAGRMTFSQKLDEKFPMEEEAI